MSSHALDLRRAAWAFTVLLAGLLVILGPPTTARAATVWQWPVDPAQVVNPFDLPAHPWESGHRGVDLAASIGQTIHASADGSVTFAGVIAGRGVVVVSHGAIRTTYEPVQSEVAMGAAVDAGDALGTLQAFAHHCPSPCLHWGAIQGDTYLDPTLLVVPKPSRLLPLWGDARPALGPPVSTEGGSRTTVGVGEPVAAQPMVPRSGSALPAAPSPTGTSSGPPGGGAKTTSQGATSDLAFADRWPYDERRPPTAMTGEPATASLSTHVDERQQLVWEAASALMVLLAAHVVTGACLRRTTSREPPVTTRRS